MNVNPFPSTSRSWVLDPEPPQEVRHRVMPDATMRTESAWSARLHLPPPGRKRPETRRKDSASMAKAMDKVYDTTTNVKPYIERAMKDEQLRRDVLSAFSTARELYNELIGGRNAVTLATRVATDDDIRDRLRDAVDDLRSAADRLQGKTDHHARNTTLLVAGIALGILFNPITGPETRRWLKEMISGGEDEFSGSYGGGSGSSNGS